MIRVSQHTTEGFRVMAEYGQWKVGMLRYCSRFSRLGEMERHMLTDEVFILVSGSATLCTDKETVTMVQGCVYTVPAGVWHHIVVSEGDFVMALGAPWGLNRSISIGIISCAKPSSGWKTGACRSSFFGSKISVLSARYFSQTEKSVNSAKDFAYGTSAIGNSSSKIKCRVCFARVIAT